ncbi:MAG: PDZ domain-containing protein [Pseudomonadales bacterium]
MRRIILLMAALLCSPAFAGESVEQQLKEAEQALKEAAQRLAELHAQGYEHKGPKRAMLGILLGSERMVGGVDIDGITPKSGAAQAGLKAGDKIVEIAGIDLSGEKDPLGRLSKHMKTVSPGEEVDITYLRNGKQVDVTITTQARSAHMYSMIDGFKNFDKDYDFDFEFDGKRMMKGMSPCSPNLLEVDGDLAGYFDVDSGVVVMAADAESELKGGDVLLAIDGQEITTAKQTLKLLADLDETVPAKVKRKGRTRNVDLNPHEFHGAVHKEIKVIKIETDD